MSDNRMYGEVCIGTDFRLRKYPELRQIAQGLRKKLVICSKDLKEISETPDVCPVRKLVGLNYDSRFPFTTQRLENDRVDHWSYVRPLTVEPLSVAELIEGICNLDTPNRVNIGLIKTESGFNLIGYRKDFRPESGKKHLPEENGKIYYITHDVAEERFKAYLDKVVLPYVQRHADIELRKDYSSDFEFAYSFKIKDAYER